MVQVLSTGNAAYVPRTGTHSSNVLQHWQCSARRSRAVVFAAEVRPLARYCHRGPWPKAAKQRMAKGHGPQGCHGPAASGTHPPRVLSSVLATARQRMPRSPKRWTCHHDTRGDRGRSTALFTDPSLIQWSRCSMTIMPCPCYRRRSGWDTQQSLGHGQSHAGWTVGYGSRRTASWFEVLSGAG